MPEDTGLEFASDDRRVRCTRAATTRTPRCSSARRVSCTRDVRSLPGTVRFMFQPGEEGFHGARYMIDEGVLDDPHVDAAFALHVSPNLPSGSIWTQGGPLMASADVLEITVTGKGGHASTPYLANDPMPVAAEIVQSAPSARDAPHQHVRPGRDHDHEDPRGHDEQRDPRDGRHARARCARCRSAAASSRSRRSVGSSRASPPRTSMRAELTVRARLSGRRSTTTTARRVRARGRGRRLLGAASAGRDARAGHGRRGLLVRAAAAARARWRSSACARPASNPADAHACHSNRMTIDEDAMPRRHRDVRRARDRVPHRSCGEVAVRSATRVISSRLRSGAVSSVG